MKYATAAAFRQALLARLKQQAEAQGVSVDRLLKRIVFERLIARLRVVPRGRWALKARSHPVQIDPVAVHARW